MTTVTGVEPMTTAPMRDPDFESSRLDGIVHVDLCALAGTDYMFALEFSPDGEPDQNGERGIAITASRGPIPPGCQIYHAGTGRVLGLCRAPRYVDWANEQGWRYIETISPQRALAV